MSDGRVTWPAERFYWSVIEASPWSRRGALPAGLRAVLEEDLPLPDDSVHAVCAPLDGGRLVVCAVGRSALSTVEPGARMLTPEQLPPWVEGPADPAALNLLVGEFEPRAARAERTRRHAAAIAALVLTTAFVAIGLSRRAEAWASSAQAAAAETDAALARAAPRTTADQLLMEVSRARRLADAAARIRPPADASRSLAALLRAWPTEVPSRPQSLLVSEGAATVSVTVTGDAAPFLSALKPPRGWSMDEPRLNTADNLTRLTLQLRPTAGDRP